MSYDVVVVGAGIFGASTAVELQLAGLRVLLLDAWGAGNPRATSGDVTRVTRAAYGPKSLYSRWSWEALKTWKQWEQDTGTRMFVPTGMLWLAGADTEFTTASLACLRELGIPVEEWPAGVAATRFPQFAGIENRAAIYEPSGGVLLARQALLAVVEMFQRRGGVLEIGAEQARPCGLDGRAGACVYACGPWLRELFPELLGDKMRVTRQELFYFAGSPDFEPGRFPTWIDEGLRAGHEFSFYGMPAIGPGVKIGSDIRGPEFDPTAGDRTVSAAGLAAAREYLAERFPALANATLVDSRVCQYEQTLDSHLIIDRHPEWENTWIAGGGSGHGFKLGPAVGRCVAQCVLDNSNAGVPEPLRF